MQYLKKLLPPKLNPSSPTDSDAMGFDLAETLEFGDSSEGGTDWLQSLMMTGCFILRRTTNANEWLIIDSDSMNIVMRAIVEYESGRKFSSDFDSESVANQGIQGRMRVLIYVRQPGEKYLEGCNPAAVMISDEDRVSWKAYRVQCDSCRYKRRRSSFREGVDPSSPVSASPRMDASSACANYVMSNQEDFSDACSVVPSGQLMLRMTHTRMLVEQCAFTRIKVSLPARGTDWCPIAHPRSEVLGDRSNQTADSLQLETRLPRWSEKLKALSLEFRQRDVLPSRRNFQLGDTFHFYRTSKSDFTLEVKSVAAPVSLVQAVFIAISSVLWQ